MDFDWVYSDLKDLKKTIVESVNFVLDRMPPRREQSKIAGSLVRLYNDYVFAGSIIYSTALIQRYFRGIRAKRVFKQEKESAFRSRPLLKWFGSGKQVYVKGFFDKSKKCYIVKMKWCHERKCFVSDLLLGLTTVNNTLKFQFIVDGVKQLDWELPIMQDTKN